jgi:glutamine synthetase
MVIRLSDDQMGVILRTVKAVRQAEAWDLGEPASEVDAAAIEDARGQIESAGIDTIECCFPDMWGGLCGKRLTAARFLEVATAGFSVANAPLAWTIAGEIIPLPYANADTGFPNMRVIPDLTSLRPITWRPRTAICMLDTFTPDGLPVALDTRRILRRAVDRLARAGFQAWTATELEFYLCDLEWKPLYSGNRSYSITKGVEAEAVLAEIRRSLTAFGMNVEASQTEYGPGQFEINIGAGDPLRAADDTVIFKHVVKEIAHRHSLRATFMPCPFTGANCSGLHVHQSLRLPTGNAVPSDGAPVESSPLGAYISGLLERLPELTAIFSPTLNAYKRAADYSFAANRACWGFDNRTVAIRVLGEPAGSRRAELRTASPDANPYLVLAGCLAAGADGIERKAEPPPAVLGDAYKDGDLPRLPSDLPAAVHALERSSFAATMLGPAFVESFVALVRHELQLFAASVTDWERERYREPA